MRNSDLVRRRILAAIGLVAGALALNGCVALTVFDASDGQQATAGDFSASDAYVDVVPTAAKPPQ